MCSGFFWRADNKCAVGLPFLSVTFSPPLRPEERDTFHQKRKPVCPPLEIAKQKIFNIPPSSLPFSPQFHHIHHFSIIFSFNFSLAKKLDIWHYFYQIQISKMHSDNVPEYGRKHSWNSVCNRFFVVVNLRQMFVLGCCWEVVDIPPNSCFATNNFACKGILNEYKINTKVSEKIQNNRIPIENRHKCTMINTLLLQRHNKCAFQNNSIETFNTKVAIQMTFIKSASGTFATTWQNRGLVCVDIF